MGGREECSKQSPVGSWSCFPHPILVLWASGTLGGRDRWVAESDFPVGFLHSPLRARVGPLPAFTASSDWLWQCPMPHPAQAPLFSLASRHHSWAGRGGRRARSLQLRREPFLAGATPPPRLSGCTVPWLAPPNPRVHRVCPHHALFLPASWAAPSTCFFRSCKPLLAMAEGGLRVVKGSRSDVGSCSKRLRPERQLWFLRRPRAGPSPHEGGLEGARGGSQHSGSGE